MSRRRPFATREEHANTLQQQQQQHSELLWFHMTDTSKKLTGDEFE